MNHETLKLQCCLQVGFLLIFGYCYRIIYYKTKSKTYIKDLSQFSNNLITCMSIIAMSECVCFASFM